VGKNADVQTWSKCELSERGAENQTETAGALSDLWKNR